MQVVARWRIFLVLKDEIIQSTAIASTSNTRLAHLHSTAISYEKWKSKWNPDARGQQPSKDYIRYKVRQKRADTKKALKDLLFNSGYSKFSFEEAIPERDVGWDIDHEDPLDKKDRSKSSPAARRSARAQHRRMKRKLRRDKLYEDIVNSDNVFQASFGRRWRTWTYWSSEGFPRENSATGFSWKEHPNQSYRGQRESDIESETESDDDSCVEGMFSEREVLGLPPKGPLNIEEIKNAFRLSALKWHPDKHQGPSQVMAEEKFKQCLDAYRSLCSTLSAA